MTDQRVDETLLRIPARPEYGRVVRVSAASLGLRHGLSFGDIDDLRLAIDEAVILLLDGIVDNTEIAIVFRFTDGRLELEATCDETTGASDESVARFTETCDGLLDDYHLDAAAGWLRLRKCPAPHDD